MDRKYDTINKISEKAFFPRVHTILIENLLKQIEKNWEDLLKSYKDEQRDKVGMSLHKLKEAFIKLDYRYFDLSRIVRTFNQLTRGEMGETLNYLQIAFVDKVEGFHQQVYTTISALILVINYLGYKKGKTNNPINSVKKFLEYTKDKIFKYRSILGDQIDVLQKSRDFRSKFIDHPQQHQLHDWMTFKVKKDVFLIFFKRHGNEVYMIDPTKHPFDPDFKPPVNCGKDFYIAPNEKETLKAIEVLVRHILNI